MIRSKEDLLDFISGAEKRGLVCDRKIIDSLKDNDFEVAKAMFKRYFPPAIYNLLFKDDKNAPLYLSSTPLLKFTAEWILGQQN